jgi:unsaturated rhamnogalacturonyl hydrolase
MKTIFLSLLGVGLLVGCQTKPKQADAPKWSVRMADAVMHRADTLTKYLGSKESLRWQYDVAMLAGAIDKLGNIDPKYSDYMVDLHQPICER